MNNENLINNSNIICQNCGTSNMSNTKFCVTCGNQLLSMPLNQPINNNMPNQQYVVQNNVQQNIPNQVKSTGMNYFKYILNVVIKPFDTFKKEESNLSSFKNSGILAGIVIVALTILNLISTMIASVRITSYWTDEVEWVWENLKNIEYFKVIGQDLLTYAGIIFAISGIYFLASLVIKKDAKFVKLLSATVTAFIPLAIAMSILSPLLSLIYSYLGLIIKVIGCVYFIIILLELLNDQIVIENKNTRIYFHLVCLSILLVGGGFIAYKITIEPLIGSTLGGFSSLFG